jgi:hypothetical protein
MPDNSAVLVSLEDLVTDFARAVEVVDSWSPVAVSSRTGTSYQPGIGPHTEAQTVKLVMTHLAIADPARYGSFRLGVSYGDGSRQACDLWLGDPTAGDWAIEVKMLRLMGDNGKPNDNMIMHILSPYPAHRSALTDCVKLVDSRLASHKAILIYGYDYPGWPVDPVVDAFEALACRQVNLSGRIAAPFDGLIHPVHQRGSVLGWEMQRRDGR